MSAWLFDHGVYRLRTAKGVCYRIQYRGGRYTAAINRMAGFPSTIGVFASLAAAKAACEASKGDVRGEE